MYVGTYVSSRFAQLGMVYVIDVTYNIIKIIIKHGMIRYVGCKTSKHFVIAITFFAAKCNC